VVLKLKVKDGLSVSKRAAHKFDVKRLDLKNLNNVEVKEQNRVKISNRFAPLENLYYDDDEEEEEEEISGA
jgi:hypothetical protein